MNNNLKKVIIFVCFFVILLCIIILATPKNVKKIVSLDNNNINIYLNDKYLIKDYSTFYTIESIIQNIVNTMNNNNFKDMYNIISKNFKDDSNKKEYILKLERYFNDNFKIPYDNNNNLISLFRVKENEYIAKVKTLNGSTNIGISIINNEEYVITYLDI